MVDMYIASTTLVHYPASSFHLKLLHTVVVCTVVVAVLCMLHLKLLKEAYTGGEKIIDQYVVSVAYNSSIALYTDNFYL